MERHSSDTSKAFTLALDDEWKRSGGSKDIPVKLEDEDAHSQPTLPHMLTPTLVNNLASSNGSVHASQEATSESSGQQPSVSTTPAAETNITSFHSHDIVSRTEWWALQLQYPQLPGEVSERWNYTQSQEELLEDREYLPSRQDEEYIAFMLRDSSIIGQEESTEATMVKSVERSPRRVSTEHYQQDSDECIIGYKDEDDYPPLPFPDEYWTYDNEAENYYHIDQGEDGRETKVWYPLEFLKSHKQNQRL
ncbi:hypothetical protein PG999_001350 [Apiospora kogelbergensis]|uniref:Uncharacterized protein n=1 Tax=Apiospora kogelbergensis TaxID=1337665 RepID=A0AAW0REE8_9PEZI